MTLFKNKKQKDAWTFGVGKDRPVWAIGKEIHRQTHTLIAGTTGSGKSVLLNSIIWSYLAYPDYYLFIDLKRVELVRYKNHPRTLGFVKLPDQVIPALDSMIQRMEDRYTEMEKTGKVKSDRPHIHIIIDELADLLTYKGVEERITKLMRLGRAANIHLLMATQSPNRKVITANIQQNLTCAIALRCKSAIESRQIIGVAGAENLPKYGTGLLCDTDGIREVTIPMTSEEDITRRVMYGE